MYYFIVNPNARRGVGEQIWNKLECRLKRMQADYEVCMTRGPGDARRFAEELTGQSRGPRVIIGVGGDGTVNEILNGLSLDAEVTLGYIPAGGGNDLARSLHLPKNPVRCLKKIMKSKTCRLLDYGILSYGETKPEYRRFMLSSGIGLNAAVSQELLELRRKKKPRFFRAGRMSYILLGIKQLLVAKPVKGYFVLDGIKKVEFNHIYLLTAHIHPFGSGGFRLMPSADSSDGKLGICVVHSSSKRKLVPVLWDVLMGRMEKRGNVHFYECREVEIHTERPMPVHVDGESCFLQKDIQLRCVEKKIRMMV